MVWKPTTKKVNGIGIHCNNFPYLWKTELCSLSHRDDAKHIINGNEANTGHFQTLLDFRIHAVDQVLAEHLKTKPQSATYKSRMVQNEIIDNIGSIIRRKIIKDIEDSGGQFSVSKDKA